MHDWRQAATTRDITGEKRVTFDRLRPGSGSACEMGGRRSHSDTDKPGTDDHFIIKHKVLRTTKQQRQHAEVQERFQRRAREREAAVV